MDTLSEAVQTFVLAQSHADGDPKMALEMQSILLLLQTCEKQMKLMLQNIQNAISQRAGVANAPTDLWNLSEEQIVCLKHYLAFVNSEK